MTDPFYKDIILYLQTLWYQPIASRYECHHVHHQDKIYLILNDTLYHHDFDAILQRFLTHEEAETILNDFHAGACGGHLSGLATTQKILHVEYFWPSIFKDCIETVKKWSPCQMFTPNKCTHPASLHPIVVVGPFAKWGIDFVHYRPISAMGMATLSWLWTISQNGMRQCPNMPKIEK